mgnify:CR=1 FL=1
MHDDMMDMETDKREASKEVEPSAKKQLEGSIGKIDELVLMMMALKEMMPQLAPSPSPVSGPGTPPLPPTGPGAGAMPMGSSMPTPPPMGGGGMMPAMQLQQAMQGARGLV